MSGDPDHTAGPVPLQQMPHEKLASHTYCQDHRSPQPVQTVFILHRGVCKGETVSMGVHTEGNNPDKDSEPRSVIFYLMRERGTPGTMYLQISSSHCE